MKSIREGKKPLKNFRRTIAILCFCTWAGVFATMAQIRVTGTVTDVIGDGMPGVVVSVRGTSLGAATDINGEYSITVPSDTCALSFGFIGFETQTIVVGTRRVIPVVMRETTINIDEAELEDLMDRNAGGVEYYQVSLTVRDKNILARELAPLDSITDHNPKFLLTLDEDPPAAHNGIKQLNALDWLLKKHRET